MRLVMMGTGAFAVPTLQALYDSPHEVLALVTQPPRVSRGRPAPVNPMRALAEQHLTPIYEFEQVNSDEARATLAWLRPELLIVADYGQILSRETLAIAPHGGVNLHGSLLPKYRGAAPINWAVYHGDRQTGVTTIHMTPQVDAGPCLAQATTPIDPEENAVELECRLAALGAPLVLQTIDMIAAGSPRPLPQDPALATKAPRLKKTDGAIDWSRSASAIKNQIRALEPWPKSHTFWLRKHGQPLRLILEQVRVVEGDGGAALPGTVIAAAEGDLYIATGQEILAIDRVQPAGKRPLATTEFLRGYPLQPGDRLGAEVPTA